MIKKPNCNLVTYFFNLMKRNMTKLKSVYLVVCILTPTLFFSQSRLTSREKKNVIKQVQELIDSNYVFLEKVKYINNSLDSVRKTRRYKNIKTHKAFADALTKDLVAITKDKHFKVQYNPELVKGRRAWRERMKKEQEKPTNAEKEEKEERVDWDYWYAQKENFGFEKVEILDGNIGYIKLNFWQPLEWVKPTIDATMKFVANTDALIIDLTENQGGYSPTNSYLASYFFNEEPTLFMSSYERRSNETETVSTFREIGGERYLNKPLFILVSKNTFSLAENFAYSLKHFKKATIIGQKSAGAAHAIDFIEVNDNYLIQLPITRNIHPVTKKDWEGTGVIPNIKTSEGKELKTVHLKALNEQIERLQKQTIVGPILKRYKKIKQKLIDE